MVVLPADREDRRRREGRKRERAHVEERLVHRMASRAPLHGGDRHGERQSRPGTEHGRPRERADRADGDRAPFELERERLADADGDDDHDEAEHVGRPAEDERERTRRASDEGDECDERDQPARERQEPGPDRHVAPRVAVSSLLLGRERDRARGRRDELRLSRHGRESGRPLRRDDERLGARLEHAVSPLELRPVDGEVGLVDELVRIGAVARVAGDAAGDRGADRLARGLDLEDAGGDGTPDALGDLERLLASGLGKQDRELLAAEASGNVVVAKLLAEDVGDPAKDDVAREVAVRVVDVAQQVEVGHDDRHRPTELVP